MKFIDLFAGLGGFHAGLVATGGFECVFASELDSDLRNLYYKNYGIVAEGDITKIDEKFIPNHDVLCAGFPCQPFSLAGKRKGSKCPTSGKLINDVLRITKHHLPQLVILENVPNILTIEGGKFWNYIEISFNKIGYKLIYKIISPEDVGIPQNRKRVFILGCRNEEVLSSFQWLDDIKIGKKNLTNFIGKSKNHGNLETPKVQQLKFWQCLLDQSNIKSLPSLSIVAPEFGATYPIDFQHHSLSEICQYRGAYGVNLGECQSWSEVMLKLPAYTRSARKVQEWLLKSVRYSRELYAENRVFLNKWLPTLDKRYNSWQILEWRGYLDTLDLSEHILQFRASGIRVLKRERVPSLIAMTPTQVPIIGSEFRYISVREAASLQWLHKLPYMLDNNTKAFKAIGNAVNAKIVEVLATKLKTTLN